MSDPFSIAAAAISLLDIGIKTTREISSLVSSMRDASGDLIKLNSKVRAFEALLYQLRSLLHSYSRSHLLAANQEALLLVHRTLIHSEEDLKALRGKLDEPIRQADPTFRRVRKTVKFPFKEAGLKKLCARLDDHTAVFTSVLSIVGRY